MEPRKRRSGARGVAVCALVVGLDALWLMTQRGDVGSTVLLAIVVVCATSLAMAALRLTGRPDGQPDGRSTGFIRTLAVILAVSTTLITGYFGASTVDIGWFGGGITHGPRSSNEVALTFDDGPNTVTTPALMKLLDDAHVQGTFFVVGKAVVREPAIVRALVAHGHLVGNHSYEHDQWRWLDPRYPELARAQAALRRNGIACAAWYRPPHGQRTPFLAHVVTDHRMQMVLWDDSAGDWATSDAHLVAQRILSKAHGGSIIVLHDGLDGDPTADRTVILRAMPEILRGLQAKGLQPVRLDKLLGVKAPTAPNATC